MVSPKVVHNRDRDILHFIFLQRTATTCHNYFIEIQGTIMLIIKILHIYGEV